MAETKIEWCDKAKFLEKRFWSYVDIRTPTECWEWQKGLFQNGYGQFRVGRTKQKAHRVAYFLWYGYLPKNLICHHCDNPKCVNPTHLFNGTSKDNSRDRDRKGRAGDGGSKMKRLTGTCKGINNPAHKLTPYNVHEIRCLCLEGYTYRYLAKKFGVCTSTIGNINHGKTWQNE